MNRFGGMKKVAARTGRSQCGGDFLPISPALPMPLTITLPVQR